MATAQTQLVVDPPVKLKAADVVAALERRHGCGRQGLGSGEWVTIDNALSGFASAGGGIDLLAIGVWRSAKAPGLPGAGRKTFNAIVAYEIKVSRSDFRRELYGYQPKPREPRPFDLHDPSTWQRRPQRAVPPWPLKAEHALRLSNYFMFAVPAGLLTDDEIALREKPTEGRGLYLPSEVGLVEVGADGRCRVRADATASDAKPLTAHMAAELIRYGLRGNAAG